MLLFVSCRTAFVQKLANQSGGRRYAVFGKMNSPMKSLRIGISARGLNSFVSGPSEYIAGLTGEMVRQTANRHKLFIYYNTPRLLGRFAKATERVVPGNNAFLWDHFLLPIALLRDQLDLVIYPKGTIPFWSPTKNATIMLDLGYFYPALNAYKPATTLYTRTAMKYAALRSKVLFTISEYTRQDTIRILKADPNQVYNIYGATSGRYRRVDDPFRLEEVRRKYDLPEFFMFYPTNISPRKNFQRLLSAFEKVMDQIPHHLYFTGQLGWNTKGMEKQLERMSARVHKMGEFPAEDMAAIYSLAQFTVYPSLFEGLGLPIIESFQCGTPVLVSDQSSIPEVAGNAALTVDAYSIDSIAEGILKLSSDAELRRRLTSAGYEQAKKFTWEKSVKIVLKALEENF